MSAGRNHIMRQLRLQLKTGFLKEEPAEYTFMKRYPPLYRDTKPRFEKIEKGNVPYIDLYNKAIERRPLYDERIFPAFWQQQPQALIVAKKQYEFMQAGDNEETAFQKAEQYISELENEAYLDLKALHERLEEMGAKQSFVFDKELVQQIDFWQEKLRDTAYEDLDDAEQGDIDYLIQHKILKWTEVERERRMKDPVFVLQFEKVRGLIFPEGEEISRSKTVARRQEMMDNFFDFFGVDPSGLRTAAPFFVEDYIRFFNMLQANPLLNEWEAAARNEFNTWVMDTLVFREFVDKQPLYKARLHAKTISVHFFPMLQQSTRAGEFAIPQSAAEFRALLYKHDVGYKTIKSSSTTSSSSSNNNNIDSDTAVEDSTDAEEAAEASIPRKLYVNRFYKIPALLFPSETFTAEVKSNVQKLQHLLADDDGSALLEEMELAGIDEASLPEVKQQLEEYWEQYQQQQQPQQHASSVGDATGESGDPLGMTALDDLLRDAFEPAEDGANTNASGTTIGEAVKRSGVPADGDVKIETTGANGDNSNDSSSSSSSSSSDSDSDNNYDESDEEALQEAAKAWEELVSEYKRPAFTQLDQDRDDFYGQAELLADASVLQAESEEDLEVFKQVRMENEIIAHARMEREYNRKEAARRNAEWRKRGVWLDDLPNPSLPLVDSHDHNS